MQKKDSLISASELNRYTYCAYQWYYEQLYGKKELRRLGKERNERLGLTDSTKSHFVQGLAHHKKEYAALKLGRFLIRLLFLLAIFALLFWFLKGGM